MGSEINEVAVFAAVTVVGIGCATVVDATPFRMVWNAVMRSCGLVVLVMAAIVLSVFCLCTDSDVMDSTRDL
jgi:hypothetical protein